MSKKYIIVGGVAGGGSAAARIRRLDEKAEIIIYEKGPNTSFSNCCLPNYFLGEVAEIDDLILYSPEDFTATYNLPAKVNHEVTEILADEKKVKVKNLISGEEFTDNYDYLILAPGTKAIMPRSIKGIDQDHVFSLKNVKNVREIDKHINNKSAKDILVVGGGFIGLEIAECLAKSGKTVRLVEGTDQVMRTLDEDMVQSLHKELRDNGIELYLEDALEEIGQKDATLKSGTRLPADTVIMAIGVSPDVDFAVNSGVELGETGAIKVDQSFRTNLKDVYAVGDAVEVSNRITLKKTRLALAGPAQKQARSAVDSIFGRTTKNPGLIGSSCIRLFNLNVASTGLNERECKAAGIEYMVSYVMPMDKVGLMPEAKPIHLKLIFHNPSGRILGAQCFGKGEVDKRVNVIASIICMGGDLEDLVNTELCYAPAFSTAKDAVHFAAYVGLNLLNGEYRQVRMSEARKLVESGAFLVDVRGPQAFKQAHIKGAINIPLARLRDRYKEIPKDKPVYVYCRTSWNSYYATRCLQGLGYDVYNIQGSILGLSYYEYDRDIRTGREPILTGYNFN